MNNTQQDFRSADLHKIKLLLSFGPSSLVLLIKHRILHSTSKYIEMAVWICSPQGRWVQLAVYANYLARIPVKSDCIVEALNWLKPKKSDGSGLDIQAIIIIIFVFPQLLASLFTIIVCHGHLPPSLKDCLLVLVPKPDKDHSSVEGYRPIAIATSLSKLLDWCILLSSKSFFVVLMISLALNLAFLPHYVQVQSRT